MRRGIRRRGVALYVTVLFTALFVSMLGLTGLAMIRIERRKIQVSGDRRDARANAFSAVELALKVIANNSNWRTTYTNGVESPPMNLGANGRGTLSWILEDSDGSLTDADTDLRLKGVGRVGQAVQVTSVKTTPGVGQPLSCLEVAACSGLMDFNSNSIVTTNQKIHSNSDILTSSGTVVNSNVELVGSVSGSGSIMGTTTTPVPARAMPAANVFDYYIANGTAINYASLTKKGSARAIQKVVLSPANNPYGATNAQGIYVIDCQGGLLSIEYSRIIGTLVLINPSPFSDIQFNLSMEPAVPNYPALLVQGSVEFRITNATLQESVQGVNFNPPGSPYLGSTDSDMVDSYPSKIKGLVYLSGVADVLLNDLVIDGALVAGTRVNVTMGETLTVNYDPIYWSNPPPGFSIANAFSASPGTWEWAAAP